MKTKYNNFTNFINFTSSKKEIIINESYIENVLKSIHTIIIASIQKNLGKCLGWIIDSAIDHTISIWKYNPLAGSSYIKLPKELDHPRKGFINIQNTDDNECFKWCSVRYLNPADHNPRRIAKADKGLAKRHDFKDIKVPVKPRDIHKIEEKNSIAISVFGYENKVKYPIHVSKTCCEDKHVDLLLIGEGDKKYYVFTEDINTFMYNHILNYGRKHLCRYCLEAFRTAEKLKYHIKYRCKINGKQTIKMPKKGEYIKFKNYEGKIKSPFIIYADFESILLPEDNGKQKPNESNKYQKHVACSYDYKLVHVDDKFSKPIK